MLTGLAPHYLDSNDGVKKKLKRGEATPIDPRWKTNSFAEGKLVEAIEKTWKHEPDDRIDIGHLAKFLQDAVEENKKIRSKESTG